MVSCSQYDGGAGVGVACDPGTVYGKEHHEHHHEEDDNSTEVVASEVSRLNRWVDVLLGGRL